MGIASAIETTVLGANKAMGKLKGFYSSAQGANVVKRAKGISNSVASDFKTGGFALRAGTAGAIGGGAGYMSSDGDTTSTLKGFGLGVAGAAAWTASGNKAFRAGIKDSWGGVKGMGAKLDRNIAVRARAERINSIRTNSGPVLGQSFAKTHGMKGPASQGTSGSNIWGDLAL